VDVMINKNTKNMNESMFSAIDLIRQDSKDVRDFVKKVFSDKEFKSMSKDTDFIKYLKSIYEGTMIDEESVYISTRNSNGTITTHIKESVVKEAITPPNSKKVEALKKAVQKINRKYKVQISTHPVTKGKVEIELGDGNHPDRDYHTIDKLVKKLGIKNYSVFNEATFRPNSGTMSGGTYGLDNRKYELKRDVKGVRIGDYTNVTLPKGTIIYNIPGGVFAHHRSLKSYESGQNKYFNQSTFRGISVRQEKNTLISIEKNSKILESVNEEKYFSLKKGDKLKVKHPEYKNLIFTIIKPKGSGYEYIAKHTRGSDKNWAPAGYFSSAIKSKDAELIESVNESKKPQGPVNRWLAIKNDETKHPHKKMAMGLKELKYQLGETQKFFTWYNQIKSMNELDSSDYWKRTNKHIYKIKERLINIAKTIQEIEK